MKNKTVLTELLEWTENNFSIEYIPEADPSEYKVLSLEELKSKIKELLIKERENIQEAFDQGEIMAGHNEWGSFREYKSKEDYFEKTYQE